MMRRPMPSLATEARTLASLAWPVILTSLNWTLMHLIDVAVVGHAGTAQLGALSAARAILYVVLVAGFSAMTGVLVLVAQADGAGTPGESGTVMRAGLIHGTVLGTAGCVLLLAFAPQAIAALGVAPGLVPAGAAVARAMAPAFPAQFAMSALAFFLEGASTPRRVTIVNVAILPLNALLAWMLADGRLGAPALGAVGAALATTIASWSGLALMAAAAWTMPDRDARGVWQISRTDWRAALALWPALARFGAMPAVAAALELVGFSILIALSTRYGNVTAGAFQTVFSLHNLAFALGLGMASAAGVRVGHAAGAGEPQVVLRRAGLAAGMAFALMALVAALLVALAVPVCGLFSGDPAVIALATAFLVRLAVFMPFDGLQIVGVYALRSLGDQVAAGVNGVIAFLAVTGGIGWALVMRGDGPRVLILAAGLGMAAAAVLQLGRLLLVVRRLTRPSRPQSSG
jgi:MATE family multidrug resistance protein